MTITFQVPGPIRGKGRARFSMRGGKPRTYTPEQTVSYENAIRFAAHQAMKGRPLIEMGVELRVTAIFPIPASWPKKKWADAMAGLVAPTVKPDCDNIVKSVADALNQVVYVDDKQITRIVVWKKYGEAPGLFVFIDELVGEKA